MKYYFYNVQCRIASFLASSILDQQIISDFNPDKGA